MPSHIEEIKSLEELESYLESFTTQADRPRYISTYYLLSQYLEEFQEQLEEIDRQYDRYNINPILLESNERKRLFRVDIHHEKRKESVKGSYLYILDDHRNIVRAVTDQGKDITDSAMQITDKLYPFFERVFIPSGIIRESLDSFIEAGYSGRSQLFTLKKWWEEQEVPHSAVEYPKGAPLKTILEETESPDSFLNVFKGKITYEGEILLDFYMNRKGRLKFHDGRYSLFQEITRRVEDKAKEELQKYDGIEKGGKDPSYLKVRFGEIAEEEPEELIINRFRDAVQDETTFSESVTHAGNPYYSSSVSDHGDGSNFEIVFAKEGEDFELTIMPGHHSSSLSLLKFKRAIFQEFGEGEIDKISREVSG